MAGDFEREKEKSGTEGLGQDHTREDPQILLWWQRRKRNTEKKRLARSQVITSLLGYRQFTSSHFL